MAERIDAKYESLDGGTKDQAPAEEDLAELQEAWKKLEHARERLGEYNNELHERYIPFSV
ncbi:hypothetical protein [Marinobacter sediminum]|uniref:hypothetical protein n=1 Tax=Marinobacter sediminum TaxID=256323 RepID=UPI00193A93AE|nr:hypothetical protein [Marinobacter sediminum]